MSNPRRYYRKLNDARTGALIRTLIESPTLEDREVLAAEGLGFVWPYLMALHGRGKYRLPDPPEVTAESVALDVVSKILELEPQSNVLALPKLRKNVWRCAFRIRERKAGRKPERGAELPPLSSFSDEELGKAWTTALARMTPARLCRELESRNPGQSRVRRQSRREIKKRSDIRIGLVGIGQAVLTPASDITLPPLSRTELERLLHKQVRNAVVIVDRLLEILRPDGDHGGWVRFHVLNEVVTELRRGDRKWHESEEVEEVDPLGANTKALIRHGGDEEFRRTLRMWAKEIRDQDLVHHPPWRESPRIEWAIIVTAAEVVARRPLGGRSNRLDLGDPKFNKLSRKDLIRRIGGVEDPEHTRRLLETVKYLAERLRVRWREER